MNTYDVIIIGGGASGTALLYTLAKYTDIKRIALIEKYASFGSVNSNAKNNSQTLHVGDIETNYTIDKVKSVKPASMMVARYAERLTPAESAKFLFHVPKMILAVGDSEVADLEKRFLDLKDLFPELERFTAKEIAEREPKIMEGRNPDEKVLALYNPNGYAVDFGVLSESFVEQSKALVKNTNRIVDTFLECEVEEIVKMEDAGYVITTKSGKTFHSNVVIVDTDSYSLLFAKKLGYGKEFSLIPIAGTFYFTPQLLKGKVYTMQESRLPFAAVHGDPDVRVSGKTRFGPTARFLPVLESRNIKTMKDYFASSGLGMRKTWASFFKILLEPIRFFYLAKNILYELPYIGKYFFVGQVKKIIPTVTGSDLTRAEGYGGMRLQRVNTNTKELLLGEGKIVGDHIIFNMTPSPGASVCLWNALRDAEQIVQFFPKGTYQFKKAIMEKELMRDETAPSKAGDLSPKSGYPS